MLLQAGDTGQRPPGFARVRFLEARQLRKKGFADPYATFPLLWHLVSHHSRRERRAATAILVELSKREARAVLREMSFWVEDPAPRVRRASTEGLRALARESPERVLPILERRRSDSAPQVRRAVARVLREAAKKDPSRVLSLCQAWAREGRRPTVQILRDILPSLQKHAPDDVEKLLRAIGQRAGQAEIARRVDGLRLVRTNKQPCELRSQLVAALRAGGEADPRPAESSPQQPGPGLAPDPREPKPHFGPK
jgi:3-methyladenine DNA glycosylase AlkC